MGSQLIAQSFFKVYLYYLTAQKLQNCNVEISIFLIFLGFKSQRSCVLRKCVLDVLILLTLEDSLQVLLRQQWSFLPLLDRLEHSLGTFQALTIVQLEVT